MARRVGAVSEAMAVKLEASVRSQQFDSMEDGADVDGGIQFRRFRLSTVARQLFRDGHPVNIGDRAFDLLAVLFRARGAIVSKKEIMEYVWPFTTVDESNVRFQMSALRKVLGEDRDVIKTVVGRGYMFEAETSAGLTGGLAGGIAGSTLPMGLHVPDPGEQGRPSIIVVDDDRGISEGLRGLLQSAGIRVEIFASVGEFLARFRASSAA